MTKKTTMVNGLNIEVSDLAKLNECQRIKRDAATGIVWIEDGRAGIAHSAHPNIEANRITRKMYPNRPEVRGFLYDISMSVGSDEMSMLARKYCQCGGAH